MFGTMLMSMELLHEQQRTFQRSNVDVVAKNFRAESNGWCFCNLSNQKECQMHASVEQTLWVDHNAATQDLWTKFLKQTQQEKERCIEPQEFEEAKVDGGCDPALASSSLSKTQLCHLFGIGSCQPCMLGSVLTMTSCAQSDIWIRLA
jgi:hypothetical protein